MPTLSRKQIRDAEKIIMRALRRERDTCERIVAQAEAAGMTGKWEYSPSLEDWITISVDWSGDNGALTTGYSVFSWGFDKNRRQLETEGGSLLESTTAILSGISCLRSPGNRTWSIYDVSNIDHPVLEAFPSIKGIGRVLLKLEKPKRGQSRVISERMFQNLLTAYLDWWQTNRTR